MDKASQYSMPYSLHRLLRLKEYKPGALVLGTTGQKAALGTQVVKEIGFFGNQNSVCRPRDQKWVYTVEG